MYTSIHHGIKPGTHTAECIGPMHREQTFPWFDTRSQDSNPGSLDWGSKALHTTLLHTLRDMYITVAIFQYHNP